MLMFQNFLFYFSFLICCCSFYHRWMDGCQSFFIINCLVVAWCLNIIFFLWCAVQHYMLIIEEPLAENGNHLGFEIYQNTAHNSHGSNNHATRNRILGFYAGDVVGDDDGSYSNSNSNIETSDYSDDKYIEPKKHR